MKTEMDEQIKAIEKAREEERTILQNELSRVKQEVVDVMKVRIILGWNRLQQFWNLKSYAFPTIFDCKEELIYVLDLDHFVSSGYRKKITLIEKRIYIIVDTLSRGSLCI